MTACLLCQRQIRTKITLPWILSWQALARPVVCSACWAGFEPIDTTWTCPGCGRPQRDQQLCADCQRWGATNKFQNIALFTYNPAMQAYFQQYKFKGDYRLRQVFAPSMQAALKRLNAEVVLTIPVTPRTFTTRGFNQVTGFLTDGLNQPGIQTLVEHKATAQSLKTREQRLQTSQPFELTLADHELSGRTVVLVDDIYTTGRTIRHAADLILESGAKSVTGLTLAR